MKELLKDFLAETGESLERVGAQLIRFEQDPSDARIIANIFRLVHTIKGTSGFLDLPRLEALAHAAETLIAGLRDGAPATRDVVSLVLDAIDQIKLVLARIDAEKGEPPGEDAGLIAALSATAQGLTRADAPSPQPQDARREAAAAPQERRVDTLRVPLKTVDRIMALVSDLVLTRNQLVERGGTPAPSLPSGALAHLSSLTTQLQHAVMAVRMQPVEFLFASLPRLVRDLSSAVGKSVRFDASGVDTELDRHIIDVIRDPLTHLIRNAVVHGIEAPDVRAALGKPPMGRVHVCARHEAGMLNLEIGDDGQGLDVEAIRARALAAGLAGEAELAALGPADICRFVFAPGFSTVAAATHLSGRGVGLDIVRSNDESIGGSVAVQTRRGKGAVFVLKIPVTLAIMPVLVVAVGGQRYAIPQYAVSEIVSVGAPGDAGLETAEGVTALMTQGASLPVCDLAGAFGAAPGPAAPRLVISMRVGANVFGIVADDVRSVEEIVVNPMPRLLADETLFNGATILGDGEIVLIVAPDGVARRLGLNMPDTFRVAPSEAREIEDAKVRLIVFDVGEGPLCALPMATVHRIESIAAAQVERIDGVPAVRRAGRLAPLVGAAPDLSFSPADPARKLDVLIVEEGGRPFGIVVRRIVDTVEVALALDVAASDGDSLGTFLHGGHPVRLLDIDAFIRRATPLSPGPAASASGQARILVIDASPFFRDMIRSVLLAAGCRVTLAASAAEAAQKCQETFAFDAVLADMASLAAHGQPLAQMLGAERDAGGTCLIGLCAHASEGMRAKGRSLGLDNCVGKFDRAALLATLRDAMAGRVARAGGVT